MLMASRFEIKSTTALLGIGFGPSNLALAIGIEESSALPINFNSIFTERDSDVCWHRNMMIPWSVSQVSFVKDLVTLRNPRSQFTFLNFLKANDRLDDFINLGTLTPFRADISDYLAWVAR